MAKTRAPAQEVLPPLSLNGSNEFAYAPPYLGSLGANPPSSTPCKDSLAGLGSLDGPKEATEFRRVRLRQKRRDALARAIPSLAMAKPSNVTKLEQSVDSGRPWSILGAAQRCIKRCLG